MLRKLLAVTGIAVASLAASVALAAPASADPGMTHNALPGMTHNSYNPGMTHNTYQGVAAGPVGAGIYSLAA